MMKTLRFVPFFFALASCGGDTTDTVDATADSFSHPLCERVPDLCVAPEDGRLSEPTVIAPSSLMPVEFVSQVAHNNLDVVWHADRLYAAIRTAPNHFASEDTMMYVVSSPDLQEWRYEGAVAIGTDVREPQLVSLGERLWLYYAVLGDNPMDFEPQGTEVIEYLSPGAWTAPEPAFESGLIPWRIKSMGDRLEMIGYVGGENVYDQGGDPEEDAIHTIWLQSSDGENWQPVLDEAVVRSSGASETDLVIRDDGSLVAIARNESGDSLGYGSHICSAPSDDWSDWSCVGDPRKYDSPLMLIEDDQPWLIGRRNVTETGHYDLQLEDTSDPYLRYQLDYWTRPKRCSLWRVDGDELEVTHELDLPSRGDTCFPEAIALGHGLYLVFNYTSPLAGDDVAWQVGQGGETWVYWIVVDLS